MDATTLVSILQGAHAGADVQAVPSVDLHATVVVGAAHLIPVLTTLRDHDALKFEFLAEITAVDYHPRVPRFELIYILVSPSLRQRARVKVLLPSDDPHVSTAVSVWPAANWLEREVWDMFGIAFDGHPDPRRLLMPEDWDGYPARKDYPVQIRKRPGSASPTQLTAEEFRANLMKDRLVRK